MKKAIFFMSQHYKLAPRTCLAPILQPDNACGCKLVIIGDACKSGEK